MEATLRLSAPQQTNVWEGWMGARTRAHYFADLCHRYQRLQRVVTWATLAASSGAAAALLGTAPLWLRLALALATAALSLWAVVHHYSKSGTDCADLYFRWNTLAMEYEALWNDMYAATAVARLGELRSKEAEIAKASTAFPNKEHLMRKWQRHTLMHHGARAPV